MENEIRVMFTGDSITDCNRARPIGDGFGMMGNSYVSRIYVDTWADNPLHNIHFLNSATSGDTSDSLLRRFDSEVLSYHPDYLFIMIGVNDAWRHTDGSRFQVKLNTADDTAANMEEMIQKCLTIGCKPIIVSPYFLDLNRKEFMRHMVDEINARYQKLAEKYGIPYIDVQARLDEFLNVASSYLLSADRVHPKAVGISIIARTIYHHPAFQAILHGEN